MITDDDTLLLYSSYWSTANILSAKILLLSLLHSCGPVADTPGRSFPIYHKHENLRIEYWILSLQLFENRLLTE